MRTESLMMAVLIATLASTATDAMAANEIYRWVDEKGEVHFSDMPPEHGAAEQLSIKNAASNTASTTDTDTDAEAANPDPYAEAQPSIADQVREERAKKQAEVEENRREIAAACEKYRKLVSQLEPSPRVLLQLKDGTVSRMDDDVRLETLNEANTFISENCAN